MKSLRSIIDGSIAAIKKNPSYSEATAKEKMLNAKIELIIEYIDQFLKPKNKNKEKV